ncbi:MAG: type I-C CRISPR-associated protein Cas8c/Csd1, partial [Deltaproteobacteria bacterium]|nr:type I-C CRISPR-associated protein Cas8c/Csd1 [Deltaproteobacteria bacterium]
MSAKRRLRNAECQEAFADLVSKAHSSHEKDAALNAVSLFYKDFAINRMALLEMRAENEWSGAEMLAFTFCDVENVVHESEGAKAFWATSVSEEKASAEQIVCLATGQAGALARLHPVVKRVPNGQQSGTSLVSFNAPSFESHGAKQGACSPVSEATAERYTTALNWLLSRSPTRIYRQGVRVGPEAVTLLWTKEDAPELMSMFNLFDEEQEEKAKGSPEKGSAVFEAAWKGLAPSDVDETQLFALTVGGNASRIVIRDWFTTTLGKTKTAIRHYFEDIALSEAPAPMPMFKLLSALDPPGKSKLEPSLSGKIFHAALTGKPFPRTMLTHALMRLRTGDKWWENETRTAIIKAYLRRQGRDIKVSLDENNTDTAYLLGRLFFVMEKLQLDAAGGSLNRSIRDSYFSSASATPGVVFGRILSLSMNHVSKLGKKANWLEKTKGEIIDHLGAEPFPKTLSPE